MLVNRNFLICKELYNHLHAGETRESDSAVDRSILAVSSELARFPLTRIMLAPTAIAPATILQFLGRLPQLFFRTRQRSRSSQHQVSRQFVFTSSLRWRFPLHLGQQCLKSNLR